jgi:O-antigen/teichoic acid export membrane protein
MVCDRDRKWYRFPFALHPRRGTVKLREVLRTFAVLGFGHVAGKLIGLVSAALLARALGAAGLGYFATAVTLLGFVLVAANWGTDAIGIREVSAHPEQWDQMNRGVRSLRMKLGGVGIVLTLLAAWIFRWDPGLVAPLLLTALVFPYRADWLLLAMRRSRSVATAAVVREIIFLGLVAAAMTGKGSLRFVAWAYLIADLAWALTTQWFARSLPPAVRGPDQTGRLVREGWPMVITSSMSLTYNKVDTPMLAAMRGAATAGTYWAGYTIIFAAMGFAAILSRSALPELSRPGGEKDQSQLPALVLAAVLAGGVAAMLLVGSAGEIMTMLYGAAYRPGAEALAILALALPMNFASGILLNRLVAVGRQRLLAVAAVSGATINVCLNLVLIPGLGMRGAALATLASEATLLVVGLFGFVGLPRARPFQLRVLSTVAAALAVGVVIPRALHGSGPAMSVLLAAAFSAACIPAIQGLLLFRREIGAARAR